MTRLIPFCPIRNPASLYRHCPADPTVQPPNSVLQVPDPIWQDFGSSTSTCLSEDDKWFILYIWMRWQVIHSIHFNLYIWRRWQVIHLYISTCLYEGDDKWFILYIPRLPDSFFFRKGTNWGLLFVVCVCVVSRQSREKFAQMNVDIGGKGLRSSGSAPVGTFQPEGLFIVPRVLRQRASVFVVSPELPP